MLSVSFISLICGEIINPLKHLWLTCSNKSWMGHEEVQYRRCRLAWGSQGWVDCWNSNSYQSLWHVGKANSLSVWAEQITLSFPERILSKLSIPLANMIFRLFLPCFGILTNVRVLGISPSSIWRKIYFWSNSGHWAAQHGSYMPPAQCPAPYASPWQSSPRRDDPWAFQREAEMEWKCCAIYLCAQWGFSEEYTGCSLPSTPLYALTLRKTRHERYSCHERVWLLCLVSQAS